MAVKNCLRGCIAEKSNRAGKGLFKPYDAPILYPWVKMWVQGENFRLSTGNVSSKKTEAQIKSMNFGASDGFGVKIEIIDEAGGVFTKFFQKISCSNIVKQDRLMSFQWGYGIQDINGIIQIQDNETDLDCPKLPNPNETVYSSKVHKMLITNVECQVNSTTCFKFIVSGTDIQTPMIGTVDNRIFGSDKDGMHVTDAIKALFKDYKIEVDFVEFNTSGGKTPMKFFVPPNACKDQSGAETKGPCGRWEANNQSPIIVATNWLNMTRTSDDRGIIHFWEESQKGPKLIFAKTTRDPKKMFDKDRVLGTYLVNASTCTPVISFTPNFNFGVFQGTNTGAISPLGSAEAPNFKVKQKEIGMGPGATPKDMKNLLNAGISQVTSMGPMSWIWFVGQAAKYIQTCSSVNSFANMYWKPIEAELKIQGNPAYECISLCRFYALNVVYINPFRPQQEFGGVLGKTEWFQGQTTSGSGLTTDSCNPILSNANWLITGISHDIHDGSYYTTLKLNLVMPGIDMPINEPLGGDPFGFKVQCQ